MDFPLLAVIYRRENQAESSDKQADSLTPMDGWPSVMGPNQLPDVMIKIFFFKADKSKMVIGV